MGTFFDQKAVDADGKEVQFSEYKDKVVLVVNVACLCGLTKSSYQALTDIHNKYHDKGFSVLAFPCDQFGGQEPWEEKQIVDHVREKFGVKFPLFQKLNVNGDNTHPLYKWLKESFPGDVTWNFAAKFIINREGVPVRRFEKEGWDEVSNFVEEILAEKPDATVTPATEASVETTATPSA